MTCRIARGVVLVSVISAAWGCSQPVAVESAVQSPAPLPAIRPSGSAITLRPAPTTLPADDLPPLFTAPAFSLPDQSKQIFSNADLRGRVWVGEFFFARCGGKCPTVTRTLVDVQRKLNDLPEMRFLSFAIDPEDSPDALAEYARRFGDPDPRWHLLSTGSREIIAQVTEGMGVSYRGENGEPVLSHADRFLLVDGKGQIRGEYSPWKPEHLDRMIVDARKLAGELSPGQRTREASAGLTRP